MKVMTLAALSAAAALAQHSDTVLVNPFQTPDDRARGAVFFRSQCASCHGADATGGAGGPSLATGTFRHAASDEGLFKVITKGVPGTPMPGFSMNGREIWQIVGYLRSLSASRMAEQAAGDAAKGRAIVGAQKCTGCHWLHGGGSPRGLDLSTIGARLSVGELKRALVDPSAEVAPQYWLWEGKLKSGETIKGHRLNEDTFSIQIMDGAGKLRGVDKSTLAEQKLERRSAMPSFKGRMSEAQINDVVAYLATLKGDAR
ncbi:MAG: c-type cytochrome [Acidobacteria bacterium]|nr:c-type cytochrome [Acidobacteriota bacterium]